ncbi:Transmembrane GTPase fzo [Strongyloides ratti]|uniref:Transmembrane GTPase fzo n=1 Tax=Strongyloides ratti TaxID=34506 RepID=A0A090MYD9_STRRB|nr:Transmembrane GTPase fzo [Strongyloides ratti]CEF67014.1 Transmembrane GTPase fzo [Strongyloides ratti]
MAAKFSGNLGSGDGPVNDFLNSSCQSHFGLQNDESLKKVSLFDSHKINGEGPLQKFGIAKKCIEEIYLRLEKYAEKMANCYEDATSRNCDHIPPDKFEEAKSNLESIHAILETFNRDKMKVVFFGRTSNGKSTCINAMLHRKIMPQGMGHTTCCFLQLEGSENNEKYLTIDNSSEKISFDKLHLLGHALSDNNIDLPSLGSSSLVRVHYPKKSADMLENDVVILDSPGVDFSEELDSWIDDHCLDADVFVFVCNGESAMTRAEKGFFLKMGFKELEVCTEQSALNRIFFISAKEMLEQRLHPEKVVGLDTRKEYIANAFKHFEKSFKECISKSAILTKFETRANKIRLIVSSMISNIEVVLNGLKKKNQILQDEWSRHSEFCNKSRQEFDDLIAYIGNETQKIREEVHLRVSTDFFTVTQKLPTIIERFEDRISEGEPLKVYKLKLVQFLEDEITKEIEGLCKTNIKSRIRSLQKQIYSCVKDIYQNEFSDKIDSAWKRVKRPRIGIFVDCTTLLVDFHEDLEFHFSLGIFNLARRFISLISGEPVTAVPRLHSPMIDEPIMTEITKEPGGRIRLKSESDDQNTLRKAAKVGNLISNISSFASLGVGAILVGGMVISKVSWKVLGSAVAIYGGLYMFEKYQWESRGKEELLKNQLVYHLTRKIRNDVHHHAHAGIVETERELEACMDHYINAHEEIQSILKQETVQYSDEKSSINNTINTLQVLKGNITLVTSDVDKFEEKFLIH